MWDELFLRLGRDEIFAISMSIILGVIAIVVVFITQWRRVRQAEIEASLKRDMLGRGMSAADIQAVLGTSTGKSAPAQPPPVAEDFHVQAHQFANEIRDHVKQVLNKVAAKL